MTDNPQTTTQEIEQLQLIRSYINSIKEINKQIHEIDGTNPSQGIKLFSAGVQTVLLQKELYRLCWEFIYEHPFTTRIDPDIEIERDSELRPTHIKLADDLLPWPPHQSEVHPISTASYGAVDGTTTR